MESGIGIRTPTQAIRILALLIESGVIYILIGVSSALVYKHGFSYHVFFFFFFLGHELGLYHHLHSLRTRRDCRRIPACGHTTCSALTAKTLPSNRIDFVIWRLGNLPNHCIPARREESLAQLHIFFVWHHYCQ